MKIDITKNLEYDTGYPIGPIKVYQGSLLSLEILGVPRMREGHRVTGVEVIVTNAEGETYRNPVETIGQWRVVRFPAEAFQTVGEVKEGVQIFFIYEDDTAEQVGSGQLLILDGEATWSQGQYTVKGSDIFVRSEIKDGVQHYVIQTLAYDEEMKSWCAKWTGDYILVDGEFIEYNG